MTPVAAIQPKDILVRVAKYSATPNTIVLAGSLKLDSTSMLNQIRYLLEHPQRLYMNKNDLFYLCPSFSLLQWCPIAKIDETSIKLADYLAQGNVSSSA